MSLPLLRTFLRALVPTTPEIRSSPFKQPLPSLLMSRRTYFTPNRNTPLNPLPFFTLSRPIHPHRTFHTSHSPLYARPPMHPRFSILEPQQRQKIEERIDGDASLAWANGRWVFKKRVLETSALLAPKAKSSKSTIKTSKFTPVTPRATVPRTEHARSDPRSQHAITAARRRRRAKSRSRRKSTPSTTAQSSSRDVSTTSLKGAFRTSKNTTAQTSTRNVSTPPLKGAIRTSKNTTASSPTRNVSTPPSKGAIKTSKNLSEAVPKGSDPLRPALSKSLSTAEQKSTAYQAPKMRSAAATTLAMRSSPAATQTPARPKFALPPVPPTSHVSSFFDSNRSHLARAELAPTRPPVPSRSSTSELLSTLVARPDTAQTKPRPSASWTTHILHSQLAHLRTTWAHQRRLHLLHHLLHHSHYPLSNPHRAGPLLLPQPPTSPPTLSSLACLSPQTQVQLPSSSTTFYNLSWSAYQKLYNTGVSGKKLNEAEKLLRACGREMFCKG